MKNLRINDQGLFVCEECERIFKNASALGNHIKQHCSKKDYYIKYVFENNEGFCTNCGKEVKIKGTYIQKFCCRKCALSYNNLLYLNSKETHDRAKNTMISRYGYEHSMSNINVQNKRKENNIKKYGVEEILSLNFVIEKRMQNNILKYGVKNISQLDEVKKKKEETCLKNHGVKWPMQNKDILEKAQKSGYFLKRFRDTDLWHQGSYEEDFLSKYYDLFPDIIRGPDIKYIFNGKNKVYHPDFYIPSLNLIIEIKSIYFLNKNSESIKAKEKATIANGFNYIMILDKDYSIFEFEESFKDVIFKSENPEIFSI